MDIYPTPWSSAVSEVGYMFKRAILYIKFTNGRKRFYRGIPVHHFVDMFSADSIGEYYNEWIKGVYQSVPCLVNVVSN